MSNEQYTIPGAVHSRLPNGRSDYERMHKLSITDPPKFWSKFVTEFYWQRPPSLEKFFKYNFKLQDGINVEWMSDGMTNICYNCLDIHINTGHGNKVAFHWVGNSPSKRIDYTYQQLHREVCKLANSLQRLGVRTGDTVGIYMAMAPEVLMAMLAVARIGAVHIVVFGGYSADALSKRIFDAKAKVMLAIDGCYRGIKLIEIGNITREAIKMCRKNDHKIEHLIIKKHIRRSTETDNTDNNNNNPDAGDAAPVIDACKADINKENADYSILDYDELIDQSSEQHEPVWKMANDPLFILHTSGSTGPPKGIIHANASYMLYAAITFRYTFDVQPDTDVFFCTGDVGWITGHSYNCYGPLLNRTRFIFFEGIPLHPDPGRYWETCQTFGVTHMYTAPTAIRALMRFGDEYVLNYDLSRLRLLGTVGEPINEAAWKWFFEVVGKKKCPIVDTYFQTETSAHAITNMPNAFPMKPGSASLPFFGVNPAILSEDGQEIEGEAEGYLVIKSPWPGMMRGIFKRQEQFEKVYFSKFEGYYFTGDGARRDKDGYIWITGRIDDMMNCSGHLLSSSEIEGVICSNPAVSECSVVGVPHGVKGETPYAFVVLKITDDDNKGSIDKCKAREAKLKKEFSNTVRQQIGPFAMPETVIFCSALPKTRSGKVLRRVIRKISKGVTTEFGDLSALTDHMVITDLVDLLNAEKGVAF